MTHETSEHELRQRLVHHAPLNPHGELVLYWMTGSRRVGWNYALEHAAHTAAQLKLPLVVLETLEIFPHWANDRLHCFVLQGMADNARALAETPVVYYPYVEPQRGETEALLVALARRAALVVTDESLVHFRPAQLAAVGKMLAVRLEAWDSNGLLPLRAANRRFTTAASFRRYLQKALPEHLMAFPSPAPLQNVQLVPAPPSLLAEFQTRWPPATPALLNGSPEALATLPIDHEVHPVATRGGSEAGRERLQQFIEVQLRTYDELRNHPDEQATSRLSPYLHFGHVSAHEVLHHLAQHEQWGPGRLHTAAASLRGWWQMSLPAEAFLDQLVTWRELGHNMSWHVPHPDQYETLPDWARATLDAHANDPRPHTYPLEEFEHAATHDPVWNAAQRQLVRDGAMHTYLRMLWGKKILHWSQSPQAAMQTMVELNNKYALDGCDPNSYSGIGWVLGRFDRAWGPERAIFGKIRYMSTENTLRKLRMTRYLETYSQ